MKLTAVRALQQPSPDRTPNGREGWKLPPMAYFGSTGRMQNVEQMKVREPHCRTAAIQETCVEAQADEQKGCLYVDTGESDYEMTNGPSLVTLDFSSPVRARVRLAIRHFPSCPA